MLNGTVFAEIIILNREFPVEVIFLIMQQQNQGNDSGTINSAVYTLE